VFVVVTADGTNACLLLAIKSVTHYDSSVLKSSFNNWRLFYLVILYLW